MRVVLRGGAVGTIELLLKWKAKVRIKTNDTYSALILASAIGYPFKVIKLLIDNGADVDAKNKDGLTALMMAQKFHASITFNRAFLSSSSFNTLISFLIQI